MQGDYPRPQFVRQNWLNLNGTWEFEFDDTRQGLAAGWQHSRLTDRIEVPFPYQSELSGFGDKGVHEVVWYSRLFEVPDEWRKSDVLLHFGAVDYQTMVWVNGHEVGHNRGGHVPFFFDIAPYLHAGANRVSLRVEDRQDPYQPRGKQSTTGQPRHIDYYCTTGIWQTVWLESVPSMRIESLNITPSSDDEALNVRAYLHAPSDHWDLEMEVWDGDTLVARVEKQTPRSMADLVAHIPSPKLWSPDSPHLYDLVIRLRARRRAVRRGSLLCRHADGGTAGRVAAPQRQAHLPGDGAGSGVLAGKLPGRPGRGGPAGRRGVGQAMGFNGVRKHQKIEDPRWLYWCDRLGMMVWEEMPNARAWSSEAEEHLAAEWERAVRRDFNHPCIVAWVPVNESMGFPGLRKNHPGQYAFLERIATLTRRLDPERPVVDNDGWEHTDITDICAIHDYTPTAERLRDRYAETLRGGPLPANAWDSDKPMFVRGSRYRGQPIMLTEVGGFLMERTDLPKEKWDLLVCRLRHDVLAGRPAAKVRGADGGHRLPALRHRLLLHAVHGRGAGDERPADLQPGPEDRPGADRRHQPPSH